MSFKMISVSSNFLLIREVIWSHQTRVTVRISGVEFLTLSAKVMWIRLFYAFFLCLAS